MSLVADLHADYGATFEERGGRAAVAHYGRPDSAARAVRNAVGTIEMGYGVVVVEGDDRIEFVDNAVSNRVPASNGEGVYSLLLDPQGKIETDMYVYNAGERLLLFTPPERARPLVEDWSEKVFIDDVAIRDASAEFGVFGVHGDTATEKVASVLTGAGAPEPELSFVRGRIDGGPEVDVGVTVIATDAPLGEEGYEVICAAEDAPDVFDTLLTRGLNAAPFGYRTWDALSLEAGTPQFAPELRGRLPNVVGLRNAVDFEKGCFVGQEIVSKVENIGRPSQRLVGLNSETLPTTGASVFEGDSTVGEVTRAVESPTLDATIALAFVEFGSDVSDLTVRIDGDEVATERAELPFVEGGARSARLPTYPE